jgi:hypothetical protein
MKPCAVVRTGFDRNPAEEGMGVSALLFPDAAIGARSGPLADKLGRC